MDKSLRSIGYNTLIKEKAERRDRKGGRRMGLENLVGDNSNELSKTALGQRSSMLLLR